MRLRNHTIFRQFLSFFLIFSFSVLNPLNSQIAQAGCNQGNGAQDGPGGAGNPGDQGGGGGADFLFGIAAIIAAVAPMVVAGIESEKEQKIATIETEAQIKQAEIQTSTQKEMAQLSSQTALAQAESSREVAKMNNDAQTQRLQINLAASQQQRNEERQFQQEQITYQRQMEAQRIALAERQAEESIRVAKEALEAKKLETALAGANAVGSPAATQKSGLQKTQGSPLASALVANNSVRANPARGFVQRKLAPSVPSARLLASAEVGENAFILQQVGRYQKSRGMKKGGLVAVTSRNMSGGRGVLKTGRGMYQSGVSPLAMGSFSEERVRAPRVAEFVAPEEPVIAESGERTPKKVRGGIRSH